MAQGRAKSAERPAADHAREAVEEWGKAIRLGAIALRPSLDRAKDGAKRAAASRVGQGVDFVLAHTGMPGKLAAKAGLGQRTIEGLADDGAEEAEGAEDVEETTAEESSPQAKKAQPKKKAQPNADETVDEEPVDEEPDEPVDEEPDEPAEDEDPEEPVDEEPEEPVAEEPEEPADEAPEEPDAEETTRDDDAPGLDNSLPDHAYSKAIRRQRHREAYPDLVR